MSVTFDTKDLKRVQKKLQRVFKKFPKDVDIATKNAGALTAAEVQKKTPIRKGSLKQSIQSEKTGEFTYTIEARNKDSRGTKVEDYVNTQEFGRRKKAKKVGKYSKNRNSKAHQDSKGAYNMFSGTIKKANKILKKEITTLLQRLARKI